MIQWIDAEQILHYPAKYCSNGFANSADVKIQTSQGISDDAGVTNFKLICDDDEILHHPVDYEPGDWKKTEKCPPRSAICGVQTKWEGNHEGTKVS